MNDITLRIGKALKHAKLKWSPAAVAIGLTPQAPTKWKKGQISRDTLSLLAHLTGVNPGWLLDGTGEMIEPDKSYQAIEDVDLVSFDDMVEVPYFEEVPGSCGHGAFVEALRNNHTKILIRRSVLERYKVNQSDVAAYPSTGASMKPRIEDRGIVFVDLSKQVVKDGKIYALCHGGLFKFKYLYNEPKKGVRMVSENSVEYPEETLSYEKQKEDEFEVVGYAFWVENGLP